MYKQSDIKIRVWIIDEDGIDGKCRMTYNVNLYADGSISCTDGGRVKGLWHCVPMLYSGMMDISGHAIYAGDVVHFYDQYQLKRNIGVVVFISGMFCIDYDGVYIPMKDVSRIAVLGNMYEHLIYKKKYGASYFEGRRKLGEVIAENGKEVCLVKHGKTL